MKYSYDERDEKALYERFAIPPGSVSLQMTDSGSTHHRRALTFV
jgi:hypothetical protein